MSAGKKLVQWSYFLGFANHNLVLKLGKLFAVKVFLLNPTAIPTCLNFTEVPPPFLPVHWLTVLKLFQSSVTLYNHRCYRFSTWLLCGRSSKVCIGHYLLWIEKDKHDLVETDLKFRRLRHEERGTLWSQKSWGWIAWHRALREEYFLLWIKTCPSRFLIFINIHPQLR